MKVSVIQSDFKIALSPLTRVIDNKPTLPVLANVLLRATDDGSLFMSGTNLQTGVTTRIGAKVEEAGEITLPAKTLADVVNYLPDERVDMTLDPETQTVNLVCGGTTVNIKGIDADEYPPLPPDRVPLFVMDGASFKSLLNHVMFSAASDDSRPILTGAYLAVEGASVTAATADGYRLSVQHLQLGSAVAEDVTCVVPVSGLMVAVRMIDDDDTVGIALPEADRDTFTIVLPGTVIHTQTLEGRFPDFTSIIPRSTETVVRFKRADLLQIAKRAAIFARDNANSASMLVEPDQITMTGKSAERGTATSSIACADFEGVTCDFAMNVKYLLEALEVAKSEMVILEINGATNPIMLRLQDNSGYTHIIMPMSKHR